MKRIIRLTESDLTRIVKRVIKESEESVMKPEPVPTGVVYQGTFAFDEGKASMTKETRKKLIDEIKRIIKSSIPTIQRFHSGQFTLPQMFEVNVGTSSTGTPEVNAKVSKARKLLFEGIIKEALRSFNIREDIIEKIYSLQSKSYYEPSKLDFNFYDSKKVKPDDEERFGILKIMPIKTMGLDDKGLSTASFKVQSPDVTRSRTIKNPESLINLWGLMDPGTTTEYYIEPDQESISKGVSMLKTYTDVEDLNDQLENARRGGVADVINDKITDRTKFIEACATIKNAFKRSGKAPSLVDCRSVGDLSIEWE
jgi:hypothetical protein